MFQPTIPIAGYGGWRFLQSTYTRQIDAHSASPQIQRDRDYLLEKLSAPLTVDELVDDPRLLRTAMTAFDIGDEAWKRGFIAKVLTEASDPESTFLTRLNNPQYTAFAEAFTQTGSQIVLTASQASDIADRFTRASFEIAVGEVNNDMRLSLNYQDEIATIASDGTREETILFRLLGDVPVRTVLETALGLPSSLGQLAIDKQAEVLKTRLQSAFGISSATELTSPDMIETVLQRFHARQAAEQGPSASTPGATALTLLQAGSGFGGQASQNLFFSLLL